jgi:hypothetical protein
LSGLPVGTCSALGDIDDVNDDSNEDDEVDEVVDASIGRVDTNC